MNHSYVYSIINDKEMTEEIKAILTKVLPDTCYISVHEYKNSFMNRPEIKIEFAASEIEINRVRGQRPQRCAMCLVLDTMELTTLNYGGMGERSVQRYPDSNNPNERHYASISIKIPFRKPNPNKDAVLKAIEKFATNWVKIIKENMDVIMYKKIVDYSKFK